MDANARRAFTADRQRGRHTGGPGYDMLPDAPPMPPPGGGVDEERLDRLEEKLDKLAEQLDGGVPAAAPAPAAPQSDDEKDQRIAALEAEKKELEQALQAERDAAETTRQELAALKPQDAETYDDRLELAGKELEAIVSATENATDTILGYCEDLEDQAEALRNAAPNSVVADQADSIRQAVTEIYQAANFQDVTGQRVDKVVKTLSFIEDRISHMKHTWDMDGGEPREGPPEVSADDEAALLNGPALEDEGLGQADIDAMFD